MGKRTHSKTETARKRSPTGHRLRRRQNHSGTCKMFAKGRAVGIDSSAQMINLAQTTFPQKALSQPQFSSDGCSKHSPSKNEFDRVFSNAALHWIARPKSCLAGRSKKPKATRADCFFRWQAKATPKRYLSLFDDLLSFDKPWRGYFEGLHVSLRVL